MVAIYSFRPSPLAPNGRAHTRKRTPLARSERDRQRQTETDREHHGATENDDEDPLGHCRRETCLPPRLLHAQLSSLEQGRSARARRAEALPVVAAAAPPFPRAGSRSNDHMHRLLYDWHRLALST